MTVKKATKRAAKKAAKKRIVRTTVRKTGGGRFDPTACPLYFTATSPDLHLEVGNGIHYRDGLFLVAVNEIMDGNQPYAHFLELVNGGAKCFLDSGIFNLSMSHARRHGLHMDEALSLAPEEVDGFDELFTAYIRIVSEHGDQLWGYVELDQGGMENKVVTRERLEQEHGLAPMPVFHPVNDGWEYFDYLAARYDRICVGNLVKANPAYRTKLLYEINRRRRNFPTLKWIHALGVSPNHHMNTYWFESCDSSSWLNSGRWGVPPANFTIGERYGGMPSWFVAPRGLGGEYYMRQHFTGAYQVIMFDRARKTHFEELKSEGLFDRA